VGLTSYLGSLLRRWRYVVAGLVLGPVAAIAVYQLLTPQYQANIQLFVSTSGATDLSSVASGEAFSQARTASYAQLLDGRDLAALVIEDLGLEETPEELTDRIEATVLPETVILDVDVSDASPERALAIADSIGRQFSDVVTRVETPPGVSEAPVTVSVVAAPVLSERQSSPTLLEVLAVGLLGGLLLGAVTAVVRDRLDRSVRAEAAVAETLGAPVLGLVPHGEPDEVKPGGLPSSPVAEAYRVVRTNLQFVSVDSRPETIMVTSPEAGDGKTTTAIRLAEALASAGRRVLLIEGDLRRPRVTRQLGLVGGAGLTNVLAGTADLDDVLQPVGDGGVTVLAAGPTPPNPSELLSSEAMGTLLEKAAQSYDLVLIDAAPLLPVADAAGLAPLTDGVILAVRWGVTRYDRVERSRQLLHRAGVTVLGGVLTFAPRRAAGDYSGYGDTDAGPADVPFWQRLRHRRTTV
jgi:capsular exopolysaccharide synthesis family protein